MNFSKEEDCGNLFYVYRSTFENKCSTWYLDSGCSNQMSRNQKIFLDIDSSITSKIQIGNGSIIDVKGKGIISVKQKRVLDTFAMIFMFQTRSIICLILDNSSKIVTLFIMKMGLAQFLIKKVLLLLMLR